MGEPEGGRNASFIPFMLPHYWGLGGLRNRFYTVSKTLNGAGVNDDNIRTEEFSGY